MKIDWESVACNFLILLMVISVSTCCVKIVETKIDDANGERNKQDLKLQGTLWWHPDGKMYVYYTPTHWREK